MKIKVYVVLENSRNSEFEYCGVYATLQEAENRVLEIQATCYRELNLYIQEESI